MAKITPTPSRGSWIELDPYAGPWNTAPSRGSWIELAPVIFDPPRGFRHVGLVRGARG